MTSDLAVEWVTDEDLAEHDARQAEEHERLSYAEKLDMDVGRKVHELRILELARAKLAAERDAASDFTDLYLSRQQLLSLPAPEPLIHGVLPRHAYAILRGRDHSFKSFVAIDWACCLATGKAWQAHDVEPVPVLYIAGEGAHGLAARVEAWEYAWGWNVPDDMLTVRRLALNMHQPGAAFTELLRHVETHRYGLVIVDTLRRVSGAADGNGSEMGAVIDNLDLVKQATDDGSVLVVAHTDKHDVDSRGYSGIEDDADVVWHAKRDEMFLTLELTKMKDGRDGRKVLLQAKSTLSSLIVAGAAGVPMAASTESQQTILTTLRDLFPDGAHSGKLKEASGLATSSYHRALNELKDAGLVVNTGTKRQPYYEVPPMPESDSHGPDSTTETTEGDSHQLPQADTPLDLADSHDSHQLPPDSPTTPTTPTPFRGGSTGSESETNDPSNTTEGDS